MRMLLLLLLKVVLRLQVEADDAVKMIRRKDDRIEEGRLLDDLVHDEVGGGVGGGGGGRGGGVDGENGGGS